MSKKQNTNFFDSLYMNNQTYADILNRLKRIATMIFSWENLPSSMDERYLEEALFLDGQASILFDKNYGIINTRATSRAVI